MGSDCGVCYQKHFPDKLKSFAPKDEKEIKAIEYNSKNDSILSLIESKYNYLCEIQLSDYINILENFNLSNATLPYDKKQAKTIFSINDFNEPMERSYFQSFIENKLIKLEELSANQNKEKEEVNYLKKNNLLELHASLNIKLKQYKNIEDESGTKKDIIHKKHLIPLGVLFTYSDVLGKVKFIFDLFKENDRFQNSNDFEDYLISSFFLSSYCLVSSGSKLLRKNGEEFSKFKLDFIKDMVNAYSLDNCKTLLKEFIDSFFPKENPFDWEEFKQKFEGKEGFQWILSSKGIRSKLETIEEKKKNSS